MCDVCVRFCQHNAIRVILKREDLCCNFVVLHKRLKRTNVNVNANFMNRGTFLPLSNAQKLFQTRQLGEMKGSCCTELFLQTFEPTLKPIYVMYSKCIHGEIKNVRQHFIKKYELLSMQVW